MMTYFLDPDRRHLPSTGFLVRAVDPATDAWGNVDIAHLDKASLDAWLRSRNSIEWPINLILQLFGHD